MFFSLSAPNQGRHRPRPPALRPRRPQAEQRRKRQRRQQQPPVQGEADV